MTEVEGACQNCEPPPPHLSKSGPKGSPGKNVRGESLFQDNGGGRMEKRDQGRTLFLQIPSRERLYLIFHTVPKSFPWIFLAFQENLEPVFSTRGARNQTVTRAKLWERPTGSGRGTPLPCAFQMTPVFPDHPFLTPP